MLDTGPGADDLYIPGLYTSFVAQTVLVRHNAGSYIGDDLDIGVAMHTKAGVRSDLIIIEDIQVADWLVVGVAKPAYGKVMFCLEPAHVRTGNFIK